MAGNTEFSSRDSVDDVCKKLTDLKEGMAKTITDYKANGELKYIADLYSQNTTKTLTLLKNSMFADDFSTQYEFLTQYVSVYKDHVLLLNKIRELQVMLNKKLSRAETKKNVVIGFIGILFLPVAVAVYLSIKNPGSFAGGMASNAGERMVEPLKKLIEKMTGDEYSPEQALLDLSRMLEVRTEDNIRAMKMIKERVSTVQY